jgi:hypothetical protein
LYAEPRTRRKLGEYAAAPAVPILVRAARGGLNGRQKEERMRRWLMVAALLVGGTALGEGFKNLQVLPKTISKDELKGLMKAQAKALDVECDHCHNVPDMASDDNPNKKVARDMMKMTMEINQKWIKPLKDSAKNQVTCGTCHRGKETPPAFVAGAGK